MVEPASTSDQLAAYDNPAKNYVREQWASAAERRRQSNGSSHVNYFTLPGPQCLDVKLFRDRDLIRIKGNAYDDTTLTFCENNTFRFSLIKSELPNAKDVKLSFEDLLGAGNPGHLNRLINQKGLFPYDVINLDCEEPFFIFRSREYCRQLAAIDKVFEIQRGHQRSFSLYVTLPAEEGQTDTSGENYLLETIRSNLETGNEEFKERYTELFGGEEISSPLHELYLVLVPKIILRSGINNQFEVFPTHRYTYIGTPNFLTRMISFVFDCEFRGGPTQSNPPLFSPLEQNYQLEIVKLVTDQATDVNILLSADREGPS